MHMSFWWGRKIDNFLFYGLSVDSVHGVLMLCIACGALAFIFEWIKLIQAKEKQKELIIRAKQIKTICPPKEDAALLPHTMRKPLDLSMRNRISMYACDTSLWLVLHNLGYVIMLTIMAFNLWIFLAVLIGGGLGYFVFGQMFMKINLENCQVIRDTYCMSTCAKPEPEPCSDGVSTPAAVHASASSSGTAMPCHQAAHHVDVNVDVHESKNDFQSV